jgi:hypothetical protein
MPLMLYPPTLLKLTLVKRKIKNIFLLILKKDLKNEKKKKKKKTSKIYTSTTIS